MADGGLKDHADEVGRRAVLGDRFFLDRVAGVSYKGWSIIGAREAPAVSGYQSGVCHEVLVDDWLPSGIRGGGDDAGFGVSVRLRRIRWLVVVAVSCLKPSP